jgi:hypothetical protein
MKLGEIEGLKGATVSGKFNPDGTTEVACEGMAIGLLLIALHLIEDVVDKGPNEFSDAIELICAFHEEDELHRKDLKA